jgi:hypothetical protein
MVLLAVVLWSYGTWQRSLYFDRALFAIFPLVDGYELRHDFVPRRTGWYGLELDVHRNVPLSPSPFWIEWEIRARGTTVAHGDVRPRGPYWGTGTSLGVLNVQKGIRYELRARSRATLPDLRGANCRLQLVNRDFKGVYTRVWGGELGGIVCLIAAVVWGAGALARWCFVRLVRRS